MSITFWCPGAPEAPEFNLANVNACNLLRLVGIDPDPDYYGEIKIDKLSTIQQCITLALNSERRRSRLIESPNTFGGAGSGHCRVIYYGNTDDQTLRRLQQLRGLVSYAQKHRHQITWG